MFLEVFSTSWGAQTVDESVAVMLSDIFTDLKFPL